MAAAPLPQYKTDLLAACQRAQCLSFGEFKLKSGRISPYFFNAGRLHSATLLRALSTAFAETIARHRDPAPLEFDVIFGPAYKGIPLAAVTTEKLATVDEQRFGNVSYSFDRKTRKDYGDGGKIVGADLRGKRVLIIDDVITAGTAIREAMDLIEHEGGKLVGVLVAVDRMEKRPARDGEDDAAPRSSAIGEVRREYNVPVLAVLTLDDIIKDVEASGNSDVVDKIAAYRLQYAPSD